MLTYEDVYRLFADNSCELLTTKDKYESFVGKKTKCVVEFNASCTHYNTVTLTNFIYKKSGVLCKHCMYKKVSDKLKDQSKDVDESISQEQEYHGAQTIMKLLTDEFDVKKTYEGCLADLLIRPKYEISDKWSFVQLKTTKSLCHGLYTFSFHDTDYENCCIVCICIDDCKIWILDNSFVIGKQKLNIGKTEKSEFYNCIVTKESIVQQMHQWYATKSRYQLQYGLLPKSVVQQQEQEFRRYREENFSFLEFIYPEIEGRKTDLYVNQFKVQEKVATKRKDRKLSYVACLYRTKASNNTRAKQPYKKADNDFYWVWLADNKNLFYIFPENILISEGFIEADKKSTKKTLSISMDNWTKEYCYNMDDKKLQDKLHSLFHK